MTEAEIKQMRARADRALSGKNLDALFSQWRAVIGPSPKEMGQLASDGLEAVRNLSTPTPEQLQALEQAIRLLRPAPLVMSGSLEPLKQAAKTAFPAWEAFRSSVQPYLAAIGRIDRPPVSGYDARPVGTGFLISDRCLVTNRHVLDLITLGTGVLAPGQAVVRFGREYATVPDPDPVPITSIVAAHPDLDLAILSLSQPAAGAAPIVVDPGFVSSEGTAIAAIGYPMDDNRNPAWVLPFFGDRYGVKRAAPGEITGRRDCWLYHDCTTLGGNSASPVLTLDGAHLAGIHADGMFLAGNHAITGAEALSFLAELA